MLVHQNAQTIKEYITEKKKVLKQLYLLPYITPEDISTLESCKTEIAADNFVHKLIDKYYDVMIEDFEKMPEEPEVDPMDISTSSLSSRSKNPLLKNKMVTFYDFINFVETNGWGPIKSFGPKAAREVAEYIKTNLSDLISLENYKEEIA